MLSRKIGRKTMELAFLFALVMVCTSSFVMRQPSSSLRMFSGSQLRQIQCISVPKSRLCMSDNAAGDNNNDKGKGKENEEWLDPALNSMGSRGRSLKRSNSEAADKGIENLSIEELVEQAAREQREQSGETVSQSSYIH